MASGLEENLLRLDQGRKHDARDMLALVYDRFTEGFETHDLRMAKSLIDKLG
jgi:predicted ATPase